MIITRRLCTTLVAIMPIDGSTALKRRERERAAVSEILRHTVGTADSLSHDPDGTPRLPGWHISITHSARYAAVALDAARPIGIDAEEWRPTLRRVAPRFLCSAEEALITTDVQILAAWTIKEAVFKVAGSQAVDFRTSIRVSSDLRTATALGKGYTVEAFDIDGTHFSVCWQDDSSNISTV